MTHDHQDTRCRLMAAAVTCAKRQGVHGFSLEDVAAEASVSRTTLYRYFPGGRSQLFEETVTWEIARFWERLGSAVESLSTLEERLVEGLVIGRKLMAKSEILTNLRDPEMLELVEAAQPSEPLVHGVIRGYMRDLLIEEDHQGRLLDGLDIEVVADYLMRMTLSWMSNPVGVAVTDREVARRLVHDQFLAGVVTHC